MDGDPNAASAIDDALDPSGARPGVRCRFECSRSAHAWSVRHAVIREGLSRPYRIQLSIVTTDVDADPDELVGATCDLVFDRAAQARTFYGVVARVQVRGTVVVRGATEGLAVDVEIVPALATLGQRVNCRIYQDMTVPAILRDVLMGEQAPAGAPAEGLRAYDRTLDDGGLSATDYLPPRDYCVQYDESDLDFVARLMHDEGIVYVFDQEGDHEVMRLVDSEGSLPLVVSESAPRLPIDTSGSDMRDAVTRFVLERTASPTKVAIQHHDWLMPHDPVRHDGTTATNGAIAANDREVFISNERRVREVYDGSGRILSSHDDSRRRMAIALDRVVADEMVGRGSSNVCGLGAGSVFELDRPGGTERLVALEVVHEIGFAGDTLDVRGSYENHFVCVPSSRFRAATIAMPRPVMRGPQTATVTGPEGEDIHTDAWGRIKILLHWDREGEGRGRSRRNDATSSVWVRSLQTWAGAGWGAVFIPRVGMEVLVEFIDGNPDRPLVTGCLYNGRHPPPYPLPDDRTKSTLRTWSTPDNGGYNELRFEDAADREELYIRAQRDMNELVQRNHATEVKVDQTHAVGNDRSRSVGGNEKITITGSRTITIDGRGKGWSGESVKITNDYKLDVAKTILVQAPVDIMIKCEGSSIHMTPTEITLQAGGGAKIVLNANVLIESNDMSRQFMDKKIEIKANEGAIVKLDTDARITANAKGELLLTQNAKISSDGDGHALFEAKKITVDSGKATVLIDDKDIKIEADDIEAKAETKMTLEGGGAKHGLSGGRSQVN